MQELTDALNAGITYTTPSSVAGLMPVEPAAAEGGDNNNKYSYFMDKFKEDGGNVN